MDATIAIPETHDRHQGRTKRLGALVYFLKKSRDNWKRKLQDLRGELKLLKNRVADLTRSREHWRRLAEQTQTQLAEEQAKNAELRQRVETTAQKKTRLQTPYL
jgi:chromosome segregation ATPase